MPEPEVLVEGRADEVPLRPRRRPAAAGAAAGPAAALRLAPVFILGNHRSGTTWVHQLLAETHRVDYLTAYHVYAYNVLPGQPADRRRAPAYRALAAELARLGVAHRGFDLVPITPDAPEEYNFVLSNAGTGGRLTPGNLALFLEMCDRIRRAPPDGRPLVLKNPWDYPNVRALKAMLPRARFVFVHRHPERVIDSALRTARTLLGAPHPYLALLSREYARVFARPLRLRALRLLASRRFGLGVRLATRLVADANRAYLRDAAALRAADTLSVRYEDLCADPSAQRDRILAFCGVDPATVPTTFTPPAPRSPALSDDVRRRRAMIARANARYLCVLDY